MGLEKLHFRFTEKLDPDLRENVNAKKDHDKMSLAVPNWQVGTYNHWVLKKGFLTIYKQ